MESTQQQPLPNPSEEHNTQEQPRREVRLCLVGKTGAGKSTLGNLLCPGANFKTSSGAASVTSTAEQARVEYPEHGLSLSLLDTMGLGDTAHRQEVVRQKITEGIMSLVGGVDFFFLCIKKERFTEENYLIVTYLFRAILGDRSLDNLWLVVTHADDLAEDSQAQAQWLRDARNNNRKFAEVLRMVGAQKVLFIDNNSSTNSRLDAIYAEGRESAKDLLLNVMRNNTPPRFTIESLETAQKEYDDKKAAAEAERAAEVARLKQIEVDAATAIEKEKARSAIREAELQAELKLVKARAELEAKLRAEAEEKLRNVPPPQVIHHGKRGGCVLS